jgi:hypothetical protein
VIVRRSLLLSSADSDEANDGANDPAIVRRSLLFSSADSNEANDGANNSAIVRTEVLYPLTPPPPRKLMGGRNNHQLDLENQETS